MDSDVKNRNKMKNKKLKSYYVTLTYTIQVRRKVRAKSATQAIASVKKDVRDKPVKPKAKDFDPYPDAERLPTSMHKIFLSPKKPWKCS